MVKAFTVISLGFECLSLAASVGHPVKIAPVPQKSPARRSYVKNASFFSVLQRANATTVKVHCASRQLLGGREPSHLARCQRVSRACSMSFQHFSTLPAFRLTPSTGRWMAAVAGTTYSALRRHPNTTFSISTVNDSSSLPASASTRFISVSRFSRTIIDSGGCAVKAFRCRTS